MPHSVARPPWRPVLPFRATRRNVLLVLGLAVALAVVAGVSRMQRYVDTDPRFCATCHQASPEFALWTAGSHRAIACQKCHHSTPAAGVAMLRAFLMGKSPSGEHGNVGVGSCKSCHASHDPQWPQIGASRGHRLHVDEHGIACVKCHGTAVHGFEPVSASCEGCHPGHAVGLAGMQKLHCFACHEFLSTIPGLRPTRRDCTRCHSAQGMKAPFRDHGGPMEMSCASCHHPHAPPGKERVDCGSCHEHTEMAGQHAAHGRTACTECHRPHLWTPEEKDCLRCHARAPGHARGKSCTGCHTFLGAVLPPHPVEKR